MEKSLNKPNWKFRFPNNVNLLLFSNKKYQELTNYYADSHAWNWIYLSNINYKSITSIFSYKILTVIIFRVIEKDLYVRGHFKTELETRLETRLKKIRLPLIFLNGQFLGVGIETKVLKITIYEMHFINNFYRNRQIIKSLFSLLSNVLQFIFLMIVHTTTKKWSIRKWKLSLWIDHFLVGACFKHSFNNGKKKKLHFKLHPSKFKTFYCGHLQYLFSRTRLSWRGWTRLGSCGRWWNLSVTVQR